MKKVLRLFKNALPYKRSAFLNIFFNILYVLFSLVSLAMVIPILRLLFGLEKLELIKPELKFNTDAIIKYFNYYTSSIILEYGKVEALIFICVLIIILFFFKNLFRYLAMYYLAILRNGVVKDLRNNLYKKVLILPLSYFTGQKKRCSGN
jgi:subfamily B ATP-binding cassette protein MsbA